MTTPTQTGDKPMVTEADSDRAATWYPHRDAHMHKQLAAMLAAHREAAEKETLSREQSRNVGREALANIVVKLSAIGNVLREAHFALDDSEDLSHQDPPVHAVPFENVMRLDRALRACERFAPDNEAWDGPGPLATQIIERLGGLLTPPASPEQPSPSPVTGEAVRDAIHDALVSAYRQGALDVHDEWVKLDLDDGLSDDPDFTEAAHDHAASEMPGLDAEIAALTTDQSQTDRLPRLDEGLIEAAMFAHYGKGAGSVDGLDLTANDRNWTFREGFTRMWAGVRKELRAREALALSTNSKEGSRGATA